jgi:DNA-binding NarL/FixJ family response regulator
MTELTRREREVFILLLLGCDSKEIGRRLTISWRTVADHRHEVLQKCNVRNQVGLVRKMLAPQVGAKA